MLYQALGLYKRDNAKLRRALELLEKARPLLHQNTNPRISEQTLYVAMAEISQDLMTTNAPWSFSGSTTPTVSIATASA